MLIKLFCGIRHLGPTWFSFKFFSKDVEFMSHPKLLLGKHTYITREEFGRGGGGGGQLQWLLPKIKCLSAYIYIYIYIYLYIYYIYIFICCVCECVCVCVCVCDVGAPPPPPSIRLGFTYFRSNVRK